MPTMKFFRLVFLSLFLLDAWRIAQSKPSFILMLFSSYWHVWGERNWSGLFFSVLNSFSEGGSNGANENVRGSYLEYWSPTCSPATLEGGGEQGGRGGHNLDHGVSAGKISRGIQFTHQIIRGVAISVSCFTENRYTSYSFQLKKHQRLSFANFCSINLMWHCYAKFNGL